jgi:hypothetical protein
MHPNIPFSNAFISTFLNQPSSRNLRKSRFSLKNFKISIVSFKSLYRRVGRYYFTDAAARMLAMKFYDQLAALAERGAFETARSIVRQYGSESAKIWQELRKNLGDSTVFEG